jgi:hypothetical protein
VVDVATSRLYASPMNFRTTTERFATIQARANVFGSELTGRGARSGVAGVERVDYEVAGILGLEHLVEG